MKTASITQTKNQLSALLDVVRQGETVLILDRRRPVARLEPVNNGDFEDADGCLLRLERAGLVRRASKKPALDLLKEPLPRGKKGVSAVSALLEERDSAR